jgi:hypothetical protein
VMLETAIQLMGAQAPRNLVPMLEGKGTGTGSEDEETEQTDAGSGKS